MPLRGATIDENDAMVCSAGFSTPGVAEAATTNTAISEDDRGNHSQSAVALRSAISRLSVRKGLFCLRQVLTTAQLLQHKCSITHAHGAHAGGRPPSVCAPYAPLYTHHTLPPPP